MIFQMKKNPYTIRKLPAARKDVIDYLSQVRHLNLVRGLFDIDVTDVRRAIRIYRRETGKRLSLSTYLMYVYVHAIMRTPSVQRSVLKGRKFVEFDFVDMNMTVEKLVDGESINTTKIIPKINDMSLDEIMTEVDAAALTDPAQTFSGQKKFSIANLATMLPRFIKQIVLHYSIRRDPLARTSLFGTTSFTSVSMFGEGRGWAIPMSPHPINMVLGGLEKRPHFTEGEIKIREILCVSLTLNHDLLDGAEAARFTSDFKALSQGLYGLDGFFPKDFSRSAHMKLQKTLS